MTESLSRNEIIKAASAYLRGTLKEGLAETATGAISEDDQQLVKFHGIYLQDDRVITSYSIHYTKLYDLHLLKVNRTLWLVHVDVGFRGLMRRVGLEAVVEKFFLWFFDYHLKDQFIPWRFVRNNFV